MGRARLHERHVDEQRDVVARRLEVLQSEDTAKNDLEDVRDRVRAVTFLSARMRYQVGDATTALVPERLPESEAWLRSVLESAPNMIITADRHGTILFLNRVFPPHETLADVVGTSIYDYVSREDQERVRACVASVLLTGEVSSYEITSPQMFGDLSLSVHVGPARSGGAIVGVTLVTWDITERMRLQAQLMAADRLTAAGTLACGVTHEINNPLTYVLANLSSLVAALQREPVPDVTVLRERALSALDGVERIRDIVRDLRNVAQDDGQEQLAVDVQETLESSLRIAGHEIEGRARIVRDYARVPFLRASGSRLGQVFVNLLLNAAQAIPKGRPTANEIRVATRLDESGNVVVEVSDTGTGIPPRLVPRVFEPFVTTKPANVGTGLGLYVCHQLVTRMRGQIEVARSASDGTTFRVTLPA